MAKNGYYFSLQKVADKVSSGSKRQFLEELGALMGYKSHASVYKFIRLPGAYNLDIIKYRKINTLIVKYGCSEEDWIITPK